MKIDIKLEIIKNDASVIQESEIISFSFKKNLYMSYTMLNISFIAENSDYTSPCEIKLIIDNRIVHHGLIDSFEITEKNGVKTGRIVSRGFTSLLLQNQIEPGIINNISLNRLIDEFYNLDYITHEDNSNNENYIYVHNRSTMWDGIVTLAYKLYRTYPFIESSNCIRITPKSEPAVFSYDDNSLTSYGKINDFSNIISHFDMPDIQGNYGTYTFQDSDAVANKIIRHKYIELDRDFLYNPQEALIFRNKISNKAKLCRYMEYHGYNGEDLTDIVSFKDIENKKIGLLSIKGNKTGIFTRIGVYYDSFYN
ncbi:MAG: hypothetical protein K2G63_04920 [Oscillospiraceae bacterium]|nr:hypothetical protein [Oscillospiraceae bacterium]